MDNALATLFYVFEKNLLPWPSGPVSFFNARLHDRLRPLQVVHAQQFLAPYADALGRAGITVHGFETAQEAPCDTALVLVTRDVTETRGLIAQALTGLSEGGHIVCAGDNRQGGARLAKALGHFGLGDIQECFKHKARAAWARKGAVDPSLLQKALAAAARQHVCGGEFISVPGLFGWDKIDTGSDILAGTLPGDLKGAGADFGCGYGYLSRRLLEKNPGVESLLCADIDARALSCARENLQGFPAIRTEFLWADLTIPAQRPHSLDFIVMNPPFHAERKPDISIGQGFIRTAAHALRPGGVLWMVANAHLAYEGEIEKQFSAVRKEYEGHGFKIFSAVK